MTNNELLLIIESLMTILINNYEYLLKGDLNDDTPPKYYASSITLDLIVRLLECRKATD